MRIVVKHSPLKKAFQSDSAGTIAKNQAMEKAEIFLMKCNCLQSMFIQTMKFTNTLQDITFHIVYINGRTSAALHSIQKPKRHFDKALIKR